MTIYDNTTGATKNVNRSITEVGNKYSVAKFSFPTGTPYQATRTKFNLPGTHIFVAQLDQTTAIYLKTDSDRNPWLRLIQGDVITRDFKNFTIRLADSYTGLRDPSGILYVSDGPLIQRRFRINGIGVGATNRKDIVVTTAPTSLVTLMALPPTGFPHTTGSYGGRLIVKNMGSVTIYIDFQGAGTGPATHPGWFPIMPDERFEVELASALFNTGNPILPQFATAAGSGLMAVLFNTETDFGSPANTFDQSFKVE